MNPDPWLIDVIHRFDDGQFFRMRSFYNLEAAQACFDEWWEEARHGETVDMRYDPALHRPPMRVHPRDGGADCGCPTVGDGECRAPEGPRRRGCLMRPA